MKDRISLAGVKIDSITRRQAVDILLDFSKRSFRKSAAYVNAHCVNLACDDKEYRIIQNKFDLVYAGGQGVVWASRFLGIPLPERVNILDFFDDLSKELSAKKVTVYLLGGRPEVVKKAGEFLKKKGLNIIGCMHGFFNEREEIRIIKEINELRPNILMVGMGVPKQEKWIFSHLNELQVNLCWAVGGVFRIFSGELKKAPRWISNYGLEWLYLGLQDPRRLFRRYLFGNLIFVFNILRYRFR